MSVDEVLNIIFSKSPLPKELKSAKHRWENGNLGLNAKVRIINKYSDYVAELIIKKKNDDRQ